MNPGEINLSFSPEKIIHQERPDIRTQATIKKKKEPVVPEFSAIKPKPEKLEVLPSSSQAPTTAKSAVPVLRQPEAVQPVPATTAPPAQAQNTANVNNAVASDRQEGNYRIQVYSLKTQAEADEHVANLISGGFETFWKKAVSAGQDWYIVYVGPFKDINSAKINLKALKFSGRKPILLSVSTTS